MTDYLFRSKRLGFRSWTASDLKPMSAVNADPEVMKFFPRAQTVEDTSDFIDRMTSQYAELGHCYFAVDKLDSQEFLGFIGLSHQTYEADFTPCIDIGWRLSKDHWGKGYATEGAQRCVEYAFDNLDLKEILCVAPIINKPSIKVMEKIGMLKVKEFDHLILKNDNRLKKCVLYKIEKPI